MEKTVWVVILWMSGIAGATWGTDKPNLSKASLTAEEVEIYGTFLDSYLGANKEVTNLSDRTFPLDLSGPGDQSSCLKGIELNSVAESGKTTHLLGPDISKGRAVRLVDRDKNKVKDPGKAIKNGDSVENAVKEGFKSGVLSLSEIAFDKTHRLAVFNHSFYCGSLCGQGGTIVFEKVGDKWKQSRRNCSSWISKVRNCAQSLNTRTNLMC
jgi:hypothetical protein